jgi:hypothetical protein
MTCINQFGNPVVTTVKGVSDSAVHNYMRDLRTLFNAAKNRYNEEDFAFELVEEMDLPGFAKRDLD